MDQKVLRIEDLIEDRSFVSFVFRRDEQSVQKWLLWIEQQPDNLEVINEASYILRSLYAEENAITQTEFDQEENRLVEALGLKVDSGKQIVLNKRSPLSFTFLGIAASVLIALGLGIFFNDYNGFGEDLLVQASKNGETTGVTLADGSMVILNAGSSLKYPSTFSAEVRRVYLQGEGYFDVVKDPSKPFQVVTNDIITEVLGTTFNVSAYEDEGVQVALLTGKVQLTDGNGNTVVLVQGEMATHKNEDTGFVKSEFDKKVINAWRDGDIVFKETSLKVIFNKLERHFGVKIRVAVNMDVSKKYSGSFQNESIEDILTALSIADGFAFEAKGKVITISKP